MGNGYTFELESVIFYGLALAVREAYGVEDTRVSVYGDDIICPVSMAEPLIRVLRDVGFVPNQKKSFWSGPFRESCGKHFYSGHDVTPFYVRRPVDNLQELFLLHNNLYRWLARMRGKAVSVPRYRSGCWESPSESLVDRTWSCIDKLKGFAPSNWRKPRLPDGYGDGAFIGTFDEASPTVAKRGWEGYTVHLLDRVRDQRDYTGPSRLLASLTQLESRDSNWAGTGEVVSAPLGAERFVVRKHHIPQWAHEDPRLITS
jgi:hypothetical protein